MFSDESLNIYNKKNRAKYFFCKTLLETGQKSPQKKCVHTEELDVAACERLEKDVKSNAGYKKSCFKVQICLL